MKGGAGKDVVAWIVLCLLFAVAPEFLGRGFAGTPGGDQADFELRFDLQDRFFRKQPDDELIDGRFAELRAVGKFAPRDALAGDITAYRLDDALAVSFGDRHGAPIEL